jgi:putative Mg2+ transporter-C (MgtC) family protein
MAGDLELVGRLALALVLSAAIGLEREWRQKSAGLRTYTLVGLGAALFSIAGAYGFQDELGNTGVPRDPSRVAAQVVSGIGFIGAGLIFVRQDAVRGLTTAAGVWLTAAVGLAAAAGPRHPARGGTTLPRSTACSRRASTARTTPSERAQAE